jgi:PST family polysaccharide transporter
MAKIFILARLLSPDDVGLFSLTAIALGLTESVTETGINLTILQAKQPVEFFLDTAWVISILRGLAIGLVMGAMGYGMQFYFHQPILFPLITVAALVPIIKGFINPMIVNLHKSMFFFADSLYSLSLVVAEVIGSVIFAFLLHSVWALVLGMIGAAVFEVIISFVFFAAKPRFKWVAAQATIIFKNAHWLSVATAFNYLNENVDNLLLGKLLGTHQLGIYQNAYSLGHKVNYEVTKSVHHGTIPIYARIVDAKARLRRAFFKTLVVTSGIILIGSLPLLIAPSLVVTILLGSKWLEVIPLVRILTLAGIVQSFSSLAYTLFLAQKDYFILNTHLIVTCLLTVGLISWWGSQYGLVGGVSAVLVARLVTMPILGWGVNKNLRE